MPAGQCGRRCGRAPWSWFQTAFLLPSLSDLAADLLALIPLALALFRVRLAALAYVGRHLADLLLADALHHEPGGRLHSESDAIGRADRHRVAEAEREFQAGALGLHPVADADDLQRLAVSLGHPGDHVGDQRAGKPVQGPDLALVAWPGNGEDAVFLGHLDGGGNLERENAPGPLDGDPAALDGDVDAAGNHHRHPSDSRHLSLPTRRRRGLPRLLPACSPACPSSGPRRWR